MVQYVDKSSLVAEIERRMKLRQNGYIKYSNLGDLVAFEELEYLRDEFLPTLEVKEIGVDLGDPKGDKNAKHIIDTKALEVKEVDLNFQRFSKEMDAIFALPSSETKNTEENPLNWEYAIAKHFFELGMSVSNKAQEGE